MSDLPLFDAPSTPSTASPEPGFEKLRAVALKRARAARPGKRVQEVVHHGLQVIFHMARTPGGPDGEPHLLDMTDPDLPIHLVPGISRNGILIGLEPDDPRIPTHDPAHYVLLMPPRVEPAAPATEERAAA